MTFDSNPIRILGISGSLREGSFNTSLLRAASAVVPENVTIEIAELADIPLYNEDVRTAGVPESVTRFRKQIASSDGLLIATPEYNYSIPGVLKNAIDWASRAPAQPFAGKPVAILGASIGGSGTMRAQYHLRQMAVCLDMHVLNKPEVFVRNSSEVFGTDGTLTDERTRTILREQLVAFTAWIRQLRAASGTS